jgi:hypothetical protein
MGRVSRGYHDPNRVVEPRCGEDPCVGCWPSLLVPLDTGVMTEEITVPMEYRTLTILSVVDIKCENKWK